MVYSISGLLTVVLFVSILEMMGDRDCEGHCARSIVRYLTDREDLKSHNSVRNFYFDQ